jgi:hypothetical protein
MIRNPIWRESIVIFFAEGHGFQVYFYLLIILAPVEFFSLYIPVPRRADVERLGESVQSLRSGCRASADLLRAASRQSRIRALALQIAAELDSVTRDNRSETIGRGQWDFFLTHVGLALLLILPLLAWAGAIARTPLSSIAVTMLLLLFYAVTYGVWGLAALALWERRLENRQVFVRCLFAALVILTALFYGTINPVMFLVAFLGRQELAPLAIFGWSLPANAVHLGFHLLLGISGLRFASSGLEKGTGRMTTASNRAAEQIWRALALGTAKAARANGFARFGSCVGRCCAFVAVAPAAPV